MPRACWITSVLSPSTRSLFTPWSAAALAPSSSAVYSAVLLVPLLLGS
ncbi:hypothetical protein PC119_g28040 [Phytophthora cactorum]|nr:hypothetical protein PC119_g28040 [Phytophthora cactorum]